MENKNAKPLPKTLPGYVCQQWKRCGKAKCRCASGRLHGPYFYRFGWQNGRQYKQYVRLTDVEAVRQACRAYRDQRVELRAERERVRALITSLREYELQVRALLRGVSG